MIRKIIHIDEEKCNGCGLCATACHEGAIDIINGKAKLVRENFCDGFGDCLPGCPTGAITFEEREAPAYDEAAVQENKKKKELQEKMKHLHKGGWCHPHSTRRLAFCRGCRIRQNTTPAKGALPGRLSPSTAALKTHRPRLRSAAMKAPVGLLSGRTVCDSRWRGLAPTSSSLS